MNTLLPDDIVVKQVVSVPDSFHARYDAETKEYRYYVWNEKEIDVFKRNYAYQFRYPLDVAAMQEACHYFKGTHDFTTFSSAKATIRGSKTRTLHHVACHQQESQIEFIFHGSGFLYNMVRIIVGTLLDIGQGKRKAVDIPWLLEQKDRRLLGMTVPPQGLYLWKVTYGQAEPHNPDTLDS